MTSSTTICLVHAVVLKVVIGLGSKSVIVRAVPATAAMRRVSARLLIRRAITTGLLRTCTTTSQTDILMLTSGLLDIPWAV